MNQNIQEEITKELLAIKQEIDLQVPEFIIKGCQLLNLEALAQNKKQDIIKALGGTKLSKDSQFIPKFRECLLNHLIRMKKFTLQSTNINPSKPLYLGQLITITMYYYEDRVIRSYSILEEVTKHINKSIHLYFESIRPKLKEIKAKECQLLSQMQIQPKPTEVVQETNFLKCYCNSQNGLYNQLKPKLKEFMKCNICSLNFHQFCLQLNQVPQDFVCPYCTLLNINQLNKVADQIVQSTYQQFLQFKNERHFLFQCPQKHQGYQIEMRCLRIDGKDGLNEITWPDYGELLVNQIKMAEFAPLSINYSLKKRKDDSINITHAIKYGEQNRITLIEHKPNEDQKKQFRIQQQCTYFIGIFAIQQLKASELLMDIKQYQRNYLTIEDSFNQFQKESNIMQVKISLRCPITLQIINIPARGKFCKHLQCFDLQNFLIMMENQKEKKAWKCPICKLKCFKFLIDDYQQLIIDLVQQNALLFEDLEFNQNGLIVDNLLRNLCDEKMKNQYYNDRIRKHIKI